MEEEIKEKNKINYIFIVPFIAILLSSFIYFNYIGSFNGYDQTSQRFISVLESFKKIPENSNIFIGDSQTREDIDCKLIEKNNISCYNLAVEGILPIQLGLISNEIIKSSPNKVIIGISPLFFSENINKNDDIFFFSGDKETNLDTEVTKMLDNNEAKLVSMNWFEKDLYKRKFIMPFYLSLVKSIFNKNNETDLKISSDNLKDPHIFTKDVSNSELQKKIGNPEVIELFNFNNSKARETESFKYLVKKLSNNGIKVIILEMPLNPIIKNSINKESRKNFSSFITNISKEYNANYLDLSNDFKSEEFIDLSHLNEKGRAKLAEVIRSRKKNVI